MKLPKVGLLIHISYYYLIIPHDRFVYSKSKKYSFINNGSLVGMKSLR
jgi:hypothetical protein